MGRSSNRGGKTTPPNQPVVFLPGFMGSDLIDEHGTVVCCYPENLGPGLQRMELPENPLETTYRPYGVIESYSVLGPFKVGAYSAISDLFSELGFEKDRDLFYFPYDWRLSNFRNAERLHEFVQSQRALRDQPFRIVGHSMGGVIARVFVHEYGDQHRVTSVVTMATPFLGSQHALKSLLQGYGFVVNLINGGDELPRKVMASFESTYEMLPAYDKCCFVTTPGTNGREAVDVLERSTWVD